MAASNPPPIAFIAYEDKYSEDITTVLEAGPKVLNTTICITAGAQDDAIHIRDVVRTRIMWAQVRMLRLWIEDDRYEDDWPDIVDRLSRSLRSRPLANLRVLHILQELPSQLISSILACTPRLEDLEAIPAKAPLWASDALSSPPPDGSGREFPGTGSSQPSYPLYQCELRRLAYIGDDMHFFQHLIAQSRRSLWWLMLLGDQLPEALPCLEEGNRLRHLIAPCFRRCDEVMDAATARRAAAAFRHLRSLLVSTDELVAFPGILSHSASSLSRIVLSSANALTQTAGVAVLADALRSGVPSVRKLREVCLMHDLGESDAFFGEDVLRVLRLECQAKRIRITRKTLDEENEEVSFPSVVSMLGGFS